MREHPSTVAIAFPVLECQACSSWPVERNSLVESSRSSNPNPQFEPYPPAFFWHLVSPSSSLPTFEHPVVLLHHSQFPNHRYFHSHCCCYLKTWMNTPSTPLW